jgi:hypothetical protein
MKPNSINILGKTYTVTYCDKVSDVDIYGRKSIWGQVDYWSRSIRVFAGLPEAEILQTIIHEVLHAISCELHLKIWNYDTDDGHDELDLVAMALADVMNRNNWLKDK